MDVIERINFIITAEGLNVASFARIVGIGDQTIRGIVVQKRNKPGFEVLSKILETFPDVNAEWLLTGKGTMQKPQVIQLESTIAITELFNYLREKDERIEQLIQENLRLKSTE